MPAASPAASVTERTPGFRVSRGCLLPSMDMDALLPGTLAALLAGATVRDIVNWRNRGYLKVAVDGQGNEIRDRRGRPHYRVRDILAAEAATALRSETRAGRTVTRNPAGIAA